jgi:hypothetical protein
MTSEPVAARAEPRKRGPGPLKVLWRKVRRPLVQSRFAKSVVSSLLARALRFVYWTNPLAKGSSDMFAAETEFAPAIIALWHGQHLLAPCAVPRDRQLVAMISRSADAEMNALVFEKLGFEAVRGSGGRDSANHLDKGGAKALIALKKALDAGKSVAMIADIPHGTPRDAGLGIIMLARFSRRPIIPVAMTTSRRKVLEKSWDKTTINLPFGRGALIIGEPITVPPNADPDELEASRQALTAELNAVTEKARRLADGGA